MAKAVRIVEERSGRQRSMGLYIAYSSHLKLLVGVAFLKVAGADVILTRKFKGFRRLQTSTSFNIDCQLLSVYSASPVILEFIGKDSSLTPGQRPSALSTCSKMGWFWAETATPPRSFAPHPLLTSDATPPVSPRCTRLLKL